MKKQKLVILTGAGISAESGISTFRGTDGMWNKYKIEDVASIEGWFRNPRLVNDFYNERRIELATVEPNAAPARKSRFFKSYSSSWRINKSLQ